MENPRKETHLKKENTHGWLKFFCIAGILLGVLSSFSIQNGRVVPVGSLQNFFISNIPSISLLVLLGVYWRRGDEFVVWTPRILSMVLIGFLALFSLDVFGENLGFWGTAFGLLFHNLPSMALLLVLWLSWKHEIIGGIFFILGALLWEVWSLQHFHGFQWRFEGFSKGIFPLLLVGAFFLTGWFLKRRNKHPLKGGKEFIAFG